MMDVAASDDLEIIVSNTTEAGIVYDPACKLEDVARIQLPRQADPGAVCTAMRQARRACIVLSCELIDNNGKELLQVCATSTSSSGAWRTASSKCVNEDCTFCSTLVDRIVPGRIRDAEGSCSNWSRSTATRIALLDVGEVFGVWVIEGDTEWLKRTFCPSARLASRITSS